MGLKPQTAANNITGGQHRRPAASSAQQQQRWPQPTCFPPPCEAPAAATRRWPGCCRPQPAAGHARRPSVGQPTLRQCRDAHLVPTQSRRPGGAQGTAARLWGSVLAAGPLLRSAALPSASWRSTDWDGHACTLVDSRARSPCGGGAAAAPMRPFGSSGGLCPQWAGRPCTHRQTKHTTHLLCALDSTQAH